MKKSPIKIVVLGGGFAGIYTIKNLLKKFSEEEIDVTLIDRRNYFLFTPLLHEVATATIDDKIAVESIQSLISAKNCRLKVGNVKQINFEQKSVKTEFFTEEYDYLVVAMGSTVQTYGLEGVDEFAFTLKSLKDAIELKHKLIHNFQKASVMPKGELRSEMLTVCVVGAGPTGVELAGEISDFVDDVCKDYFETIDRSEVSLNIVNSRSKFLESNHPKLGKWTEEYLKKMGWNILLNHRVSKLEKHKVFFVNSETESLNAGIIVWAAGVKPNSFESDVEIEYDKGGRILVENSLQVKNMSNVFALGDIASHSVMLAQVAVQQASVVADNLESIIKTKKSESKLKLKEFKFNDKGFLMSIGKWNAVGEVYGVPIRGWWVWIFWHAVYFMKFISIPKKIKVLLDWMLHVFRSRDISSY